MKTMKNKIFQTFDGVKIDNLVEYIAEKTKINPNLTISVGCDSLQTNPIVFVTTVMLYDSISRNGAHVIFNRLSIPREKMNFFTRLQHESELALEIAELLDTSLEAIFERRDLTDLERKKYKFHLLKNNGYFSDIDIRYEENVVRNLTLTDAEKATQYRLVDIHVDYNSKEGNIDKKGVPKNKSHISYKSWVPYLRSLGFRVFAKPSAVAASSAADILLH